MQNALLNYSTKEFLKDFYKERIIEVIEKLKIEHLLVIKRAYDIHENKRKCKSETSRFGDNQKLRVLKKV